MDDPTADEFVTRREVDQNIERDQLAAEWVAAARKTEIEGVEQMRLERWRAHEHEHKLESDALKTALQTENEQQHEHNIAHALAHEAHDEKHKAEEESIKTALAAVDRERSIHSEGHDREHLSHIIAHDKEQLAVHTALDSVNREREIHAVAHDREHEGHQREHTLNNLAIDKAEAASDKRFSAVNATREQMTDILRSLASKDTVDALGLDHTRRWEELRKELDRRFEEQRTAITNIEKGDSKQEGETIGRGTMVAIIVGATTFIGTVLGIIIVLANVLTKI